MAETKTKYPTIEVGQKYGRLTVISFDGIYSTNRKYVYYKKWLCRCECGNICSVLDSCLKNGHTRSCGCYSRDLTIARSTTHGKNKTRTHRIWNAMKERCSKESQYGYKNYGGRGIKICSRWLNSFENFFTDMGECPDGYSLERIDVNGDYCPENCKWIPMRDQSLNTRRTKYIPYKGEMKSVSYVAREIGMPYHTLYGRIFNYGFSVEEAIANKRYIPGWRKQLKDQTP